MSFFQKSGIVNVKMVITEEKILSNIDKVQKLINPNSKKPIIQLDDDTYFKDLVESIKTYLLEYPKKKNFPRSVYRAAYDLVEYATNLFEDNTKKIEDLIRKREKNIKLATVLKEACNIINGKAKNWRELLKKLETKYPADVVEALTIIGNSTNKEDEEYLAANKLIEAKVANLESNLHIEIDMERIEDRSKALSYIGIEIAEALKYIPAPIEDFSQMGQISSMEAVGAEMDMGDSIANLNLEPIAPVAFKNEFTNTIKKAVTRQVSARVPMQAVPNILEEASVMEESIAPEMAEMNNYMAETRFDVKPSLWQRIKNSKIVRAIKYVMQIRVVLDYPALPEGRGENYH